MSKVDLDKAWDGLCFEDLSWSCGCGQPMGLENPRPEVAHDLYCSRCREVIGVVTISLDPPKVRTHESCGEKK